MQKDSKLRAYYEANNTMNEKLFRITDKKCGLIVKGVRNILTVKQSLVVNNHR